MTSVRSPSWLPQASRSQPFGAGRNGAEAGIAGLLRDKTRPPGKAPITAGKTAEVVRLTQAPPPHEATHWTARAMAKAVRLGVATVQRIWAAHELNPVFKLSKDPAFVEKLHDIVGLYVHRQPMP